eukprot:3833195-Prymnesium_polylepis.1
MYRELVSCRRFHGPVCKHTSLPRTVRADRTEHRDDTREAARDDTTQPRTGRDVGAGELRTQGLVVCGGRGP